MKKLVFAFAAFAAISFASCGGNKTANDEAAADSTAVVEEVKACCPNDSAKCGDSTCVAPCDSLKCDSAAKCAK